MQYNEFIKQPNIAVEFNSMFNKQRDYFKKKYTVFGISGDRIDSVAIKMASVTTDLYFSELLENKKKAE